LEGIDDCGVGRRFTCQDENSFAGFRQSLVRANAGASVVKDFSKIGLAASISFVNLTNIPAPIFAWNMTNYCRKASD
jgi:hypothetical protein